MQREPDIRNQLFREMRTHVCLINMPIEYYSPVSGGAISTVIMYTGRELIARAHKVSVLTVVNGDETYDVGELVEVEVKKRDDLSFFKRRVSSLRWRLSGFDWPYFEYYLDSAVRKLKKLSPAPDVVIVFNDLVSPKYIKKALPETRVIVWLQNEWRTRHDMAETAASTDLLVACSEYIRQWTSRTHGISLSRFTVAHNAADLATFKPRVGYLEGGKEVRVLFVGRIDRNKGPDIVADAVTALRAEGLPVSLTLAGGLWFYGHGNEMKDPFFRLLKTKTDAAEAKLIGHVTRRDVPALFREHDIVCILSRSQDPYPLVTMEAMASGCAVIASKRGGLPEACEGAGLLVEPENFQEVVTTLRSLVTDRELLRNEKRKSVERASREPWSKCADVVEKLLGDGAAAEMASRGMRRVDAAFETQAHSVS